MASSLARLRTPLLLACLLARPCLSQESPSDGPLRGPALSEHAKRTLVHHSMTGEFQRVLGRPEAAAVGALGLDPETRRLAEEAIEQRAVDVALLLVQEIDRVAEISDAVIAQDGELAQERLRELWRHFEPDRPRDPIAPALADLLGPEHSEEMTRLLDEYWEAWVAWEMRGAPDLAGEEAERTRARVRDRLSFQLFREEVGEGYNATLRRYRDAMQGIYDAVEPTDEQRRDIRQIVLDHIRETQLTATPELRREVMVRIYRALDDPRRELLYRYLLRQVVPDNAG